MSMRLIAMMAIIGVAVLTAVPAFAQAFGLTKGMMLDQLDVVRSFSNKGTNYRYAILPPQPNAALEYYSAIVTPKHGLCYASGASPVGFGKDPERLKQRLLVALSGLYGKSVTAADTTEVFHDVPSPLLAVGIRLTDTNVVMVEYVFDNFTECQESSLLLDRTGL